MQQYSFCQGSCRNYCKAVRLRNLLLPSIQVDDANACNYMSSAYRLHMSVIFPECYVGSVISMS